MGKHSKYARKYKRSWETEEWAKGWLTPSDGTSVNEAHCKVCHVELRAHKSDLLRHKEGKGHIIKMRALNVTKNQTTLNSLVIRITNEEKERDIKLAAYVAVHSAIRSIDHLSEILVTISKGREDNLRLHRTKCSGIIKYVIGPSLLENLLEDMQDMPFSIIVDESTDISINKYMCICVKFFSKRAGTIITTFLTIIEIEIATADELYNILKRNLSELGLDIHRLIGIGTDGANNLCGKNNFLYTKLKAENPNIQLVRCICHSLNIAASYAVDSLPASIDFLCREVYNWFSHSSLRRIEYRRVWDILNSNENKTPHNFVQLSKTRWLARYECINIILENYEELKTHFSGLCRKKNAIQLVY